MGADGTILSRYTNGETMGRGKIALANFTNPQAAVARRQPVGRNRRLRPAAGRFAGQWHAGHLQAGALESSNVDLTAKLVNMITAQRVYQANAQTITTNDQLLQTIVNLR